MVKRFAALVIALGLAAAGRDYAQVIYKWTDEHGQVHYSNHGGASPSDSSAGSEPADQGWESVLEKQQGREDFQEKAEATINSLELQRIRKKRDRERAQEALEATQASIVRAQQVSNATELPTLKAREAKQITDLRKLDAEISAVETSIAKIRALKAAEKEQRSSR
ncbi:MAG TPA: DUF4124 domain-containing protein [Candidatus Binatia bacterium]|nr:DUF4124 domain-containing protein [Candidatus Binatia bacterium]